MTGSAARKPGPKTGDTTSTQELNFRLLEAAYNGRSEQVIEALENGAQIAARHEETGLSVLHVAIGTNNLPLTKALVEDWSAPFEPDGFGRMPTVVAAECCVSDELSDYIVEQEAKALGIDPVD